MQHYYFHLNDSSGDRDDLGCELPSHEEALRHAIKYAGDCLSLDRRTLAAGSEFSVEVTDAEGMTFYTVNVSTVAAPAARRLFLD